MTRTAEWARRDAPRLMTTPPIMTMAGISRRFGKVTALDDVDVTVYPGEVLGIVGESGSGKSTLLRMMNLEDTPDSGDYRLAIPGAEGNLFELDRYARRMLCARHVGIVYQNPHLGLLMRNSSSGNVAERLLIAGERRFATLREKAGEALAASEFPLERMDARPIELSGGMQQRLQIARNLVTGPRLVFMDEPTGGLDVSVQARLLDLVRGLVNDLGLSAIVVTHDLAVARLLSHRMMVMKDGHVIEHGLTDRVLDDPREPYTQLLVSSILPP